LRGSYQRHSARSLHVAPADSWCHRHDGNADVTGPFSSAATPARYRLFVKWETVENHTVDFRGSPDFAEWRKLVGYCFASPPEVEHVHEVVKGF
jgi:hypothetical protein